MARRGSLTRARYWPNTGDMLEDHDGGVCWEAVRTNTFFDEVTGEKYRYAFFLGRHPDFEEGIPLVVHDHEDEATGPFQDLLTTVKVIKRKKGDDYTDYTYDNVVGSWLT